MRESERELGTERQRARERDRVCKREGTATGRFRCGPIVIYAAENDPLPT